MVELNIIYKCCRCKRNRLTKYFMKKDYRNIDRKLKTCSICRDYCNEQAKRYYMINYNKCVEYRNEYIKKGFN